MLLCQRLEMIVTTSLFVQYFQVSAHTINSFIQLGLECGWSADEKKGVVLAIWRDLVGTSESLLDDAILAGNFDRFCLTLNKAYDYYVFYR
jgi:hypothetical protein